ncbi:MAG: hypothetical protein FWD82_10120, partial [Defluviitaleaceae bacterium]|nr:hypothetical protein [Defluviitaleaceae bacterium]
IANKCTSIIVKIHSVLFAVVLHEWIVIMFPFGQPRFFAVPPRGCASVFSAHVPAMFRQLHAGENAVFLRVVTRKNSVFPPHEST